MIILSIADRPCLQLAMAIAHAGTQPVALIVVDDRPHLSEQEILQSITCTEAFAALSAVCTAYLPPPCEPIEPPPFNYNFLRHQTAHTRTLPHCNRPPREPGHYG